MTLKEMSAQYEESAKLLRARLRELRIQMAQSNDPEEIWHLKRRIADLTPMLTEMNALAELTANYYERGYYRDEQYAVSNAFGGGVGKTIKAETYLAEYHPERADGSPEGYSHFSIDRRQVTDCRRRGARRKQVHNKQDAQKSPKQNPQDNAILMTIDDALLDSLFGPNPKK